MLILRLGVFSGIVLVHLTDIQNLYISDVRQNTNKAEHLKAAKARVGAF